MVNYEFHEKLTPEIGGSLVEDYKSGPRAARTISGSPLARTAGTGSA